MAKFYLSNSGLIIKSVSILKSIVAVLNDAIERLQMGVPAILQSCVEKCQLMV